MKNIDAKIEEYIDLLNTGYIPKSCDVKTKFKNGNIIQQFWSNNKDKIINELFNNPKYEVGYETAKEIIRNKKSRTTSYNEKIDEYINLLNSGYLPQKNDLKNKFKNGSTIQQFWANNKEKIIYVLNNDPKYQVGYNKAKETIKNIKVSSKLSSNNISKQQILKYLGFEDLNLDDDIKEIVQFACFKQNVSTRNSWLDKIYNDTIQKLNDLDTLDNDKIVDIIVKAIINNNLKQEKEEFKRAISAYLQAIKELQKLDVAFEKNSLKRIEKISKYQFNEKDIKDCILISLKFYQNKLIDLNSTLYQRRELIGSYVIIWDTLTFMEKEKVVNQNNFTQEEVSLINNKKKEMKKLLKYL